MHFDCFIVHPVVDVSAQSGCTITPISPTTLTAAGGVLAIGTVNVTIKCRIRWYDPNRNRLVDPINNIY